MWNIHLTENIPFEEYIDYAERKHWDGDEFTARNMQTGKSLENAGFVESSIHGWRLTKKAIALLEKFSEKQ